MSWPAPTVDYARVREAMTRAGAVLEEQRRVRVGQKGPCRPCAFCGRPGRTYMNFPACEFHSPARLREAAEAGLGVPQRRPELAAAIAAARAALVEEANR